MLAFSLLLSITVTVTNPQPTPRQAVPVVVPIAQNGKEINSAVIKGQPDTPWQLDDLNDDGRPDELVFLVDLKANQTKTLTVDLSSARPKTSFTPRNQGLPQAQRQKQEAP